MALHQRQQPDGSSLLLGNKSNTPIELGTSLSYRPANLMNYHRSVPEDAEFDAKSEQPVPSLSTDDSSRASSLNDLPSEVDSSGPWLPLEDGVLRRSGSPTLMKELYLNSTPMNPGVLQDRPLCDPRGVSMATANEESKTHTQHETVESELSDSDSGLEEDSDDDDTPNDEWSGANDNIEAALYQAVYPDVKLAAHLISTMYPTIVLNYKKRISRKVHSWQENITTCGTDSRTASTAKEKAPQGASNAANKSSPKRDRQSSSPDDNTGDDEDDDVDDSRRKRRKDKEADNERVIPAQRLACPFYKKDPVKYSAAQSGRKSCTTPGFPNIARLKEHLKRAHRPVQCARCYQIFPHKGIPLSSAIAELEKHIRQEERCDKRSDSLKEGINDVEWERIGEEKKTRKRKSDIPEKPQSALEQWYEIWVILFPGVDTPPTPWYEAPFYDSSTASRSQGQEHFLGVLANVLHQKLPEIKNIAISGTDEEFTAAIINLGQKTYATWGVTYSFGDASTSSFSNINISDQLSSGGSGSWQPVEKDLEVGTQNDQSTLVGTSTPKEAMMDRREMSVDRNQQALSPNTAYVGTSRNIPNNHNYSGPFAPAYAASSQTAYHNPASSQNTYPDVSSHQVAYPNGSTPTIDADMPAAMWSPNMYGLATQSDFDINSTFDTIIPNIPRWGDPTFGPNFRGFGAP